MKLWVTHKTVYTYDEAVPLCHNVTHLRPRTYFRQKCLNSTTEIHPAPASRTERIDFFGNHVEYFTLQEPHRTLALTASSEVETYAAELPPRTETMPWEDVPAAIRSQTSAEAMSIREFAYASPRVPILQALADLAKQSFTPGRPIYEASVDLTKQIHRQFRYDSMATAVTTSVQEVLQHRRGVCQDFAHVLAGCLRSIGMAARYVSGYLLTHPAPGKTRLIGADASHAWASVYIPKFGWLDLDPTNGVVPGEEHVVVAWARDYDDVCPVKGVILGGRQHTLKVSVDVDPRLPVATPPAAEKPTGLPIAPRE